MSTIYALVNRLCGHAGTIANDRTMLQRHLALLDAGAWFIREATDDDLLGVVSDHMCDLCLVDSAQRARAAERATGASFGLHAPKTNTWRNRWH
ncbi:hypothetical protein [Curtobacterium sp. VKM Ac-1376]|uniref:hypothetical protein n=1 Tax=Curtobacterium sp. VKM Ac-1376 TaxID=123312 RepID=UPI00188C3137|nr:hypothetical protein [Curtobacterium sp. VKM Ac-1376]MBF4613262.1 hypothetical protein [Curtobacterium sp. VKM Ac-1376]